MLICEYNYVLYISYMPYSNQKRKALHIIYMVVVVTCGLPVLECKINGN